MGENPTLSAELRGQMWLSGLDWLATVKRPRNQTELEEMECRQEVRKNIEAFSFLIKGRKIILPEECFDHAVAKFDYLSATLNWTWINLYDIWAAIDSADESGLIWIEYFVVRHVKSYAGRLGDYVRVRKN